MYKLLSSNVEDENFISLSLEDQNTFVKVAAKRDFPAEVDEAIRNLSRRKNHSYLLTTAMGDGETWGANKNGDYFPNEALLGMQNTTVDGIYPDKDERLKIEMNPKRRFETFQDGHFFHHHRNKIDNGDPDYGYIDKAIWNPKMRTVLLILGVDRNKDPETAEAIDRNELLAFSMGAKLPWDRCSACGSKHKTTFQYCHHLKFDMGKILGDGRRVCAENLFPRFFDYSKVTRPAFLAGMQLEKIASQNRNLDFSVDLAEYYDIGRFDKYAESEKTAILYKQIPTHIEGAIARACNTEKDLPKQILDHLSELKPQEAWGALTHAGIIAKPNEFAYILTRNSGREDLANQFINKKAIVSEPKVKGLDERLHALADININNKAVRVSRCLPSSVIDDRSISQINNRVYETDRGLRKHAGITGAIGLGGILSALYLLYRKNAEHKFSAYGLLGAGVGLMASDHPDATKYIGNDPYITDQMNKQAGALGTSLRMAGGFAVPYIASAHLQNKMERGEQVGPVGRFVANNPGKLGIVGALGVANPKALYSATKTVASDAAKGVKGLFSGK